VAICHNRTFLDIQNMTPQKIHALFQLMASVSDQNRDTIRTLYLDSIGADIIPYCQKYYAESKLAPFRSDMVKFVIRYARVQEQAIILAKAAMADRSKLVKKMSCKVLAYSLCKEHIPMLRSWAATSDEDTRIHATKAILVLETGDINKFVQPSHDQWHVSLDSAKPPSRADIDYYIVKYAPKLVQPIGEILGSIYPSAE